MKRHFFLVGLLIAACVTVIAQGPLTPLASILGRADSSGYLITTAAAYTPPDTNLTALANLRVRTDSNGYLITTLGAASTLNAPITITGADGTGRALLLTGGGLSFGATATSPVSGAGLRAQNNTNFITVRNAANTNDVNFLFLDTNNIWNADPAGLGVNFGATTFAALGTPINGTLKFCSDCTEVTPASCPVTQASCICAGSGTGAFARRVNNVWYCTF